MSKIPQETLELIASANDIVEVIGSYFPLKRAGATYKAICPFHQEKSPSFTVNPQRQIFKCFGCGAGGGVFKFVELYENLSFPEAAKKLAERAGIKLIEEQPSEEDDRKFRMRKRLLALHLEAADWFHRNLLKTKAAAVARDYLQGRGITSDVAKSWKLGYAPDSWDALGNWARAQGFTPEEIVRSGLAKVKDQEEETNIASLESAIRTSNFYDRFRDRVMFPICNDYGEVIAFSGRELNPESKGAKYVNSPETILFTKGNVLFGLHKSKRALIDKNSAIVCEGQLDLITAFEAGVQNVIAPQGTAFTEKQARILKRYVEEVVLCFDADAAGQKASDRSLSALIAAGLQPTVTELPKGDDPDSFIRKNGASQFEDLVGRAEDFFEYKISKFLLSGSTNSLKEKSKFAREIAALVNLIENPMTRESTIVNIASKLEFSAKDFDAMVRSTGKKPELTQKEGNAATPHSSLDWLCLIALRDPAARGWICSQPQDFSKQEPGADLLIKILEAAIIPEDSASVNAFISKLSSEESETISALLLEKLPDKALEVAQDSWRALERRSIKRRQEALASRLRLPDLPMTEVAAIQKEILDLQKRLPHIARPLF
jgi:DNA primase